MPRTVKKVIFCSLILRQQSLTAASNAKFSFKVPYCILNSIKMFLIQNYFFSNAKKYKLDEILTNFDLTTDSQIGKHYTILIIFKIRIF